MIAAFSSKGVTLSKFRYTFHNNRKRKMSANSKKINFRLGDLTTPFFKQCKIENISASELMRKALLQYLRLPEKVESQHSFSVENKHDFGEKKKVVITFNESEFLALEKLRKFAYKPTYQAVIIAIFRAYISEEPYLNEQEILLLKDANTQLLAIGRNLNQIARKINSGEFKTKLDSQYLEQLVRACQNHENYYRGLINRATLRRKIKVEI